MEQRKSCWEVLNCAREKSCPAYPNNGRNCYAVTATWCKGVQQGSYGDKIEMCRADCDFYRAMMNGAM